MFESHVVKRTAEATSSSLSWLILRVCETAECRYRLCGITVAPIIPKAPEIGVIPRISGEDEKVSAVGIKPLKTAPQSGFESAT